MSLAQPTGFREDQNGHEGVLDRIRTYSKGILANVSSVFAKMTDNELSRFCKTKIDVARNTNYKPTGAAAMAVLMTFNPFVDLSKMVSAPSTVNQNNTIGSIELNKVQNFATIKAAFEFYKADAVGTLTFAVNGIKITVEVDQISGLQDETSFNQMVVKQLKIQQSLQNAIAKQSPNILDPVLDFLDPKAYGETETPTEKQKPTVAATTVSSSPTVVKPSATSATSEVKTSIAPQPNRSGTPAVPSPTVKQPTAKLIANQTPTIKPRQTAAAAPTSPSSTTTQNLTPAELQKQVNAKATQKIKELEQQNKERKEAQKAQQNQVAKKPEAQAPTKPTLADAKVSAAQSQTKPGERRFAKPVQDRIDADQISAEKVIEGAENNIQLLQKLRDRKIIAQAETSNTAATQPQAQKPALIPNAEGRKIVENMRRFKKSEAEIQQFLRDNVGLTEQAIKVSQAGEQTTGNTDTIKIPPSTTIIVPSLTIPLPNQTTPDKKPSTPSAPKLSEYNLRAGAAKYPNLFDPTDRSTFDPKTFAQNPNKENYFTLDSTVGNGSPLLNKASISNLPYKNQIFYTTRDSILIGTRSSDFSVSYIGRSTQTKITQVTSQEIDLLAIQFVQTLGQPFSNLNGPFDPSKFTVFTTAVKITNPLGVEAGNIKFSSNIINPSDPSIVTIPSIPNIGAGSTDSKTGGISKYTNLGIINTPIAVQGYLAEDFSSILKDGANLSLGSIISATNLSEAGLSFSDLNTGRAVRFQPKILSTPGIKILQPGGGMNDALLTLNVDPTVSSAQKDILKLQSLTFIPFGEEITTKFTTNSITQADWYTLSLTQVTTNTRIKYNTDGTGSFTSNKSNFGAGLVASTDGRIDPNQSINTSIPFLLAGAIGNIDSNGLNGEIEQAYKNRDQGILPIPLDTRLNPETERNINRTIEQTVQNLKQASILNRVATSYTPTQTVYPDSSAVFTFETGLSNRAVQYRGVSVSRYTTGPIKISTLNIPDFNALGFVSAVIPTNQTNISTAVETYIIDPTGQKFLIKYSSKDNTVVPVPSGNNFNLIFGNIGFSQDSFRSINIQDYYGNINVPTFGVTFAGKKDNVNFGASVGGWFNVNPNSAPGVAQNNSGLQEPGFGLKANAFINSVNQSVDADKNGKVNSITTLIPYLNASFNTAANPLNPNIVTAGLSFSNQTPDYGLSIVPSIAYIPNNSNGDIIGLLQAQFATFGGFKATGNIEAGKNVYYTVTLSQTIAPNLNVGVFASNSTNTNNGLNQRVSGFNVGGLVEYNFDKNSFAKAKVGTGENGTNVSVQVGGNF